MGIQALIDYGLPAAAEEAGHHDVTAGKVLTAISDLLQGNVSGFVGALGTRDDAARREYESHDRAWFENEYRTNPVYRAQVDAHNAEKKRKAEEAEKKTREIRANADRLQQIKKYKQTIVHRYGDLEGKQRQMTPEDIAKEAQLQAQLSLNNTPTKSAVNQTLIQKNLAARQAFNDLEQHRAALLKTQLDTNTANLAANRNTSDEVGTTMTQDISQMRANLTTESQTRAVQNQIISSARQKQLAAEAAQQLARQIPAKTGKGKSDLLERVMVDFNMSKSTAKKYIKKYGSN